MIYKFSARGHPNITARHKTTLEFTKDSELSLRGDCIIGVRADFELHRLKEFLDKDFIEIKITAGGLTEKITAIPNKEFCSEHEIVIRKGDFLSERTLGIRSNKACADLGKKFLEKLKEPNQRITIEILGSNI